MRPETGTGLFVSGHMYELWGLLDVGIFGLGALWVTLRTGGLEAAMSIHIINNWVAFGFMVLAVGGETKQTETGAGLGSVIGEVVGLALYAWWVDRIFVRKGGPRTRIDLVQSRPGAVPVAAARA